MNWHGAGYHRVATVQEGWGKAVIARIPPGRYNRILDAGCGSGRVTIHLLRRFPNALVVGVDRSPAMIEEATRNLRRFSSRVRLVEGDLLEADPGGGFDLVFSNATFHWVLDHRRLFANVHRWLKPGGVLAAQYGAKGNISRVSVITRSLGAMPGFRERFRGFERPTCYATAAADGRLLREAGFAGVRAWTGDVAAVFRSRPAFRDFMRHVVFVPNLARLDDPELKEAYLEGFIDLYERRFGRPYLLDYVRLNVHAVRGDGNKELNAPGSI